MLKSITQAIVTALVAALLPELKRVITEQIGEGLPRIVDAVVLSVAKTGATIAQAAANNTVDRITDIIPGTADDDLLDPLVKNIFDQLRERGVIR